MDFPTLLAKENSDMYAAIARVREIHRKHETLNYCLHCGVDVKDPLGPQQYPCPTVAALEGEQS